MTLFELLSLSAELHNQLYERWGVFISLHVALLGGLFAFDLNIKTSFKAFFLLFYSLFSCMNLVASVNLLNQISALINDLNTLNELHPLQSQLALYLQQTNLPYFEPLFVVVHLIIGLIVLLGIFFPSKKGS